MELTDQKVRELVASRLQYSAELVKNSHSKFWDAQREMDYIPVAIKQNGITRKRRILITKDEERLHELIPHLLIDFKLAILEEDMEQTIQQLSLPEVAQDVQRTMEIMTHYKKLTETLKEMAKRAGDRVILKA